MTVRQILAESSNVGTITIAKDSSAGPELARWIDRFGFGRATGIELPGESAGMVLPYDHWSGSTIGTVPIGQGIAVTPLQMVERVRRNRQRRRHAAGRTSSRRSAASG